MTRKDFLLRSAAFGAAVAAGGGSRLFAKSAAEYDDNLTVFLSDTHVPCAGPEWNWILDNLGASVAEILKMDPLPRRAVFLGDLSHDHGPVSDYRVFAKYVKLLEDAGVECILGMGNHDRRGNFLEVFPDRAKTSPVPGRLVSVASLGAADLILLDSLQGKDGEVKGLGAGALDGTQQEWLAAELPKRERPVFVAAHHPLDELSVAGKPLKDLLFKCPQTAGYLFGHRHKWLSDWVLENWKNPVPLRTLGIPSAGYTGEIGYAVMRTRKDSARMELRIRDFVRPGVTGPRPAIWDKILENRKGEVCDFTFA